MNESQLFHLFGAYFSVSVLMFLFRYFSMRIYKACLFHFIADWGEMLLVALVIAGAVAIEIWQGLLAYPLDTVLDLIADAVGLSLAMYIGRR